MSLFGNKPKVATSPPATDTPPAVVAAPSIDDIVSRVVETLKPLIQQPAPTVQQQQADTTVDDDTTPEEHQRISRIANQTVRDVTNPYAEVFNMAMPGLVRDSVVRGLNEGQRIIYERHKDEVDASVDRACSNNPSLKGVAEIHKRAISLVLGDHSDEIEELVIARITHDQLPVGFSIPNTTSGGSGGADAPTREEQDWVAHFAPRSRDKDWDVDKMRYYKSIRPGFVHEMIAEHRERQKGK